MKKTKNKLSILLLLFFQIMIFAQPGATDGVYLDGSSIIIPNDTKYINKSVVINRTIEGWFKADDATNTGKQFIYKEGGGLRGVVIYIESGYLILGAYNAKNTDYTPLWKGTFFKKNISSNTWYHFAIVLNDLVDATNSNYTVNNNTNLKFYLNGILQIEKSGYKLYKHGADINLGGTNSNVKGPLLTSSNWNTGINADFIFNERTNITSGNYFTGRLFGIRVWNSARSINEINDNKNNLIYTVGDNNLVAALIGEGFAYLDNSDNVSVAYDDAPTTYVWSYGNDNDWLNSINWDSNGVPPNNYEIVKIDASLVNYPVISSDIFIGDLTIKNGATITVNSGATLTVGFKFVNNGEIIVEDGASFIFQPNLPASGTFEVKRNSPVLSQYFYSYWSTPLLESNSSPSTAFVNYPTIYKFNANQNPTDWADNAGANFIPGHGYAVRQDNLTAQSQQITFNGTVNNGNIDVELFYNPSDIDSNDKGNNLLGNPYPAAIDWKAFNQDSDNTDILNGTVYIWSQSVAPNGPNLVSDYITCTNSGCSQLGYNGEIASGQGFFVTRKDPSTNPGADNFISFKNSHRFTGNNQQFFRRELEQTNQSWFKLTKDNSLTESLFIGFMEEATNYYDNSYDGIYNNSSTSLGFYSLIDNEKMAVQTLNHLTQTANVKLGYKYDTSGIMVIEIDQEFIDSNFDIILENTYTNEFINLRNSNYSFNVYGNSLTEVNDQFILHFRSSFLNNTDLVKEIDLNVYIDKENLQINTNGNFKNVSVFDINGRQVLKSNKMQNYIGNLSKGFYIVKIKLDNGQVFTRKIIY